MGVFCDRLKFGSTAALESYWPKHKQISLKRAFIATLLAVLVLYHLTHPINAIISMQMDF